LSLDTENYSALKSLGALHAKRGNAQQAIEMMLRAEAASGSRGERIALLWEAATLADGKLADPGKALELYQRVLKLEPDHVEAGQRVADQLVAAKRWDDVLPVLEMLARLAEGQDKAERGRRQAQLGKAYEELHRTEKAARHHLMSVEANPDIHAAARRPAAVLMVATTTDGNNESAAQRREEVDRRYRDILAH